MEQKKNDRTKLISWVLQSITSRQIWPISVNEPDRASHSIDKPPSTDYTDDFRSGYVEPYSRPLK